MTDRRVRIGPATVVVDGAVHAPFWDLVDAGRWEPFTVTMVAARAGPGAWFVDVGAWIGPLTLLAAACGARVVAYEPDPVARAQLEANLARNPELTPLVEVRATALGRRRGRGRLDGGPHGLGNSLSRVARHGDTDVDVEDASEAARSEAFLAAALVKIDVEGAERAVVPRLRRYLRAVRPPLLLSLHGYDLRVRAEGRAHPPAGTTSGAGAVAALGAVADRLARHLRTAGFRLVGARRRLPVLWALRGYPTVAVAVPASSIGERDQRLGVVVGGWAHLSRPARWLLALRLADVELYCLPAGDSFS